MKRRGIGVRPIATVGTVCPRPSIAPVATIAASSSGATCPACCTDNSGVAADATESTRPTISPGNCSTRVVTTVRIGAGKTATPACPVAAHTTLATVTAVAVCARSCCAATWACRAATTTRTASARVAARAAVAACLTCRRGRSTSLSIATVTGERTYTAIAAVATG
jgi:hypothetical protein